MGGGGGVLAGEAVERFPERRGSYVRRAELAMRREAWTLAVGHWESVRVAFPEEASGYERCTVALMEAGRWDEAESLAEESVRRFPERPGATCDGRSWRCVARPGRRRSGLGRRYARRFRRRHRGMSGVTLALMEAGRWEEAEALAGEAVVCFPERRWSYVRRAEVAMRREDWAVAVGSLGGGTRGVCRTRRRGM